MLSGLFDLKRYLFHRMICGIKSEFYNRFWVSIQALLIGLGSVVLVKLFLALFPEFDQVLIIR